MTEATEQETPFTVDQANYNQGRTDFARGFSLRTIIERFGKATTPAEDDKAQSYAIGFVDALVDRIRAIPIPPRPVT